MGEPRIANVRAVERAMNVLKSFSERRLQSLAEVARASDLDKGTTRRLLLTLMRAGFVVQDPSTQHYGLGRVVRDLSAHVVEDFDIMAAVVPLLADLARGLGVTSFLSVYRDGGAVCLERLADIKGFELHWWPKGGTLPLNSGGAPKLLLAYQSREEIERVLSSPLGALTPETIRDRRKLKKRLELIRERGYEFAIDDVVMGLTALAVPVLDRQGRIVCALSIAGLTPQMLDASGGPAYLRQLKAAALAANGRLAA